MKVDTDREFKHSEQIIRTHLRQDVIICQGKNQASDHVRIDSHLEREYERKPTEFESRCWRVHFEPIEGELKSLGWTIALREDVKIGSNSLGKIVFTRSILMTAEEAARWLWLKR